MAVLIAVLALLVLSMTWRWVARHFKKSGSGWLLRNLVGSASGFLMGLLVLIVAIESGLTKAEPQPSNAVVTMDALTGLLLFAAAIAVFVWMVRRTNAKGRDLERQTENKPWLSARPELLTKVQRKAVNPPVQQPQKRKVSPSVVPVEPRPAKKVTRAIRSGWSIGQVEFSYEDSKGDITYRTVTVHSITRTYLKGECHGRQAERTFRLDGIIGDLVDCETGEVMSPKKWAKEKNL